MLKRTGPGENRITAPQLWGALAAVTAAAGASAQPMFVGLGDLPGGGFYSRARAVSADGLIVAGTSYSLNGTTGDSGCCEAFIWTVGGGMLALGDLPGGAFESEVFALSADGAVAVGGGHIGVDLGFSWDGGLLGLAELPGGAFGGAVALGTSADGSIIVGSDYGPNGREAFRLVSGDGAATPLGDLAGGDFWSEATGVSSDGQRIVGMSRSGQGTEAFLWTQTQGMRSLGDLAGGALMSRAAAIAADGVTIVGAATSALGPEAFLWTEAGGMQGLGDIEGGVFTSEATAVSADGLVVVGRGFGPGGEQAMVWTPADGPRAISEVIEDLGFDLGGWQLRVAYGVSADGGTIVGRGVNPEGATEAWLARLTPVCAADCTGGGTLDLFDFLCFVNLFNSGDLAADCDSDGDLALFDFLCFVNLFNDGC